MAWHPRRDDLGLRFLALVCLHCTGTGLVVVSPRETVRAQVTAVCIEIVGNILASTPAYHVGSSHFLFLAC